MPPIFLNAFSTAASSATFAVIMPGTGSMSMRATVAPAFSSRAAVALPMPRAAPVTTAVLPFSSNSSMGPVV